MSSLAVTIQFQGLDRARAAIERLAGWDKVELMETIGRVVQLQTRQRLAVDKEGPNGEAWPPNRKGSSLLYQTGALHDSIDYIAGPDEVVVGSPLVYAAIHHFGGVIKPKNAKALAFMAGNSMIYAKQVTIPARPYIGISSSNETEIEGVVADFLQELVH